MICYNYAAFTCCPCSSGSAGTTPSGVHAALAGKSPGPEIINPCLKEMIICEAAFVFPPFPSPSFEAYYRIYKWTLAVTRVSDPVLY